MTALIDFFAQYPEYWDQWAPRLMEAAQTTIWLTVIAYALAFVLGLIVAGMRLSESRGLRTAARVYTELFRGVPVLALLFLLYFGLPGVGVVFDAFTASVIGLALSASAYLAEVFRSGLQALHAGQREAAMAIGMKPHQAFRFIVLPQVIRVTLPPLLTILVALLKDSSLCALITVNELMLQGRAISSEYFLPLHIFLLVGAVYFVIAYPISLLARRLEIRFGRGRRTIGA